MKTADLIVLYYRLEKNNNKGITWFYSHNNKNYILKKIDNSIFGKNFIINIFNNDSRNFSFSEYWWKKITHKNIPRKIPEFLK